MLTFNQIPPVHKAPAIYYGIELGDIMFRSEPNDETDVMVYRSGPYLYLEHGDDRFSRFVRDHDDDVSVLLHSLWVMWNETQAELADEDDGDAMGRMMGRNI